jgi:hypothetical protein
MNNTMGGGRSHFDSLDQNFKIQKDRKTSKKPQRICAQGCQLIDANTSATIIDRPGGRKVPHTLVPWI